MVRWTDGKTKSGECRGFQGNLEGRCWEVVCVDWNGTARVWERNTFGQIKGRIRAQNSIIEKVEEKKKGILIATLNIRSGRAGGRSAARRTAGKRRNRSTVGD